MNLADPAPLFLTLRLATVTTLVLLEARKVRASGPPAEPLTRPDLPLSRAGGAPLLARITRKSRDELGIATDTEVHALIKSVALAD